MKRVAVISFDKTARWESGIDEYVESFLPTHITDFQELEDKDLGELSGNIHLLNKGNTSYRIVVQRDVFETLSKVREAIAAKKEKEVADQLARERREKKRRRDQKLQQQQRDLKKLEELKKKYGD